MLRTGLNMHRFMLKLARIMAYLGGAVLCLLVLLTCLSIIGRSLNRLLHGAWAQAQMPELATWLLGLGIGPINGDFELVEAGVAFAVFAFLPLCQISGGHAAVDVFTARMSARANRVLARVSDTLFAAVLVLIAVQLARGLLSKYGSGQTSFLLEFPLWWAYAASLIGAVAAALVAVYLAVMQWGAALGGTRSFENRGADR